MEPIATLEAFSLVIGDLVADVAEQLSHIGKGARRLDGYFHRVDGHNQAIRVGTAAASRDARHPAKLLCAKIETIEPGEGIEAMTLLTPLVEALGLSVNAIGLRKGVYRGDRRKVVSGHFEPPE